MHPGKEAAKKSRETFEGWVVQEILKAKARWIQACLATILPVELYEHAKKSTEVDRLRQFFKANGYAWKEFSADGHGESRLYKGPIIVSFFRPILVGERENTTLDFQVEINGKPVDLEGNVVVLARN